MVFESNNGNSNREVRNHAASHKAGVSSSMLVPNLNDALVPTRDPPLVYDTCVTNSLHTQTNTSLHKPIVCQSRGILTCLSKNKINDSPSVNGTETTAIKSSAARPHPDLPRSLSSNTLKQRSRKDIFQATIASSNKNKEKYVPRQSRSLTRRGGRKAPDVAIMEADAGFLEMKRRGEHEDVEWNRKFLPEHHYVYTDGSWDQKRWGGIGIYHGPNHPLNRSIKVAAKNNEFCEASAIQEALMLLKQSEEHKNKVIVIRTDCLAVIEDLRKKTQHISDLCSSFPRGVRFEHVYAHDNDADYGNRRADMLARAALGRDISEHRSRDRSKERNRSRSKSNDKKHIESHVACITRTASEPIFYSRHAFNPEIVSHPTFSQAILRNDIFGEKCSTPKTAVAPVQNSKQDSEHLTDVPANQILNEHENARERSKSGLDIHTHPVILTQTGDTDKELHKEKTASGTSKKFLSNVVCVEPPESMLPQSSSPLKKQPEDCFRKCLMFFLSRFASTSV